KAEAIFTRAFALPTSFLVQAVNKRMWPAFLRSIGRYDDALAAAGALIGSPNPVVQAAGHVAAGMAWLGKSEVGRAARGSNAAARLLQPGPPGTGLVVRYLEQLQGEFYLRTGSRARALDTLRKAIADARLFKGPDESIETVWMIESSARAAREVGEWTFSAEA